MTIRRKEFSGLQALPKNHKIELHSIVGPDFGSTISMETQKALDDIDRNILNALMKAKDIYFK